MTTLEQIKQAGAEGKLLSSAVSNLETWLTGNFLPGWALKSIEELVAQGAWEELNNRFYKALAFGTGGMRERTVATLPTRAEMGTPSPIGTPEHAAVGMGLMNDFNIIKATIGLFRYSERYLKAAQIYERPKLVIAHDVRHFSRHFCELAASTWSKLGGLAMIFEGPRSTPQLSFSVRYLKATVGVVITASHNPQFDNGFKAYFADGAQVVFPHAEGIIEQVLKVGLSETTPYLEIKLDQVVTLPPAVDEAYLNHAGDNVLDAGLLQEARPKIVFTPIHGTGGVMSIPLMKKFGVDFEVVAEQAVMDGRFPTVKSPNPEYAEALTMGIALAKKCGADAVLATDPDCDRMGVAVRNRAGEMELLTGNMIGALLAEYRLSKMKELGLIPAKGGKRVAIIKTFVTTPLQDAIGHGHGVKVINTLTGFKWIGEKLKHYEEHLKMKLLAKEGLALDYDATSLAKRRKYLLKYSTFYVCGGEESYGYLADDLVRDKDANAAVLMFCELAAHLKKSGLTFGEYLDSLYLKYGYFLESLLNIYYEGATGAAKIKKILDSYRADPPKEIGGQTVTGFKDFGGKKSLKDADGKVIPKENFYFLDLANGYTLAVRGSGTEPKIKFYLFAREQVGEPAQLAAVKEQTRQKLAALKGEIEADARRRAEG